MLVSFNTSLLLKLASLSFPRFIPATVMVICCLFQHRKREWERFSFPVVGQKLSFTLIRLTKIMYLLLRRSLFQGYRIKKEKVSHSVVSDSVQPHRRQPTRHPCPWDSPGKNTGVGCHFLLQCMKVKSESEVAQSGSTLSDPWTAAYQAPLSMDFPGKSTGVGCHCLLWEHINSAKQF